MLTGEILQEVHERAHHNLRSYMAHAGNLDEDALNRELSEIRGWTVRLQLLHAIGAERHWIGVLEGQLDVEETASQNPGLDSLERYRQTAFGATRSYLLSASKSELNTPRAMLVDPGVEEVYVPGQVVMRTITHIYHHQGQIAWMFRLLGSPHPESIEDFDYPITGPT